MTKIIRLTKNVLFLTIGLFISNSIIAQKDKISLATQLIKQHKSMIGLSDNDIEKNVLISDSYYDKISGTTLVYLQQSYLDLPIYNQLQVLAFKNNKLVSNTGGRIDGIEERLNGNAGIPEVSAETAIITAVKNRKLKFSRNPFVISSEKNGRYIIFDNMNISSKNITAELMWVPLENENKIALAWQIYIVPIQSSDYWMIRVDAINNKVIGVNNFTVYCNWDAPAQKNNLLEKNILATAPNNPEKKYGELLFDYKANSISTIKNTSSPSLLTNVTYRVVPYPYESPSHYLVGHPDSTALITNPWDSVNSNPDVIRFQWNNNGSVSFDSLRGNNVFAQEDRNGNNGFGASARGTVSGDTLLFNFRPNFRVTPTQTSPVKNQQFNTTNLFYWNNIIHDLSYLYGFDEEAGNFQSQNLVGAGSGGDYVIADAQDASGTNNANFSTPSDGNSGRMQMYLWSGSPQKDGDADNGVICHEFTHGISNRLTGGPSQAGCLNNSENMGEGWSDYYALMFTQNWATANLNTGYTSPRPVGTYVMGQANNGSGIRTKKYSTDSTVNNLKFSSRLPAETHDLGEIWCAVLWDMTWKIINECRSINPNLYNTSNDSGGNSIALKIVTLAMKLQPCSPGFIDGRNAILKADSILYNQRYSCAISEVFRRRGMGKNATQGSSNSVTDQVADFGSSFISKQPKDIAACIGSDTSFSATALGLNNKFIWEISINNGGSFNTLPNDTTNVLKINNVQASMNNYQYRLTIINPTCGALTTNPVTLRVLPVLSETNYTINPATTKVCAGNSATFELNSAVTSPYNTFKYNWQIETQANGSYVNLQNDTTSIMTITNIPDSFNNSKIRMLITDKCGIDTSGFSLLSVIALPQISLNASPSNILSPGRTVTIAASTNASVDSIQWFLNNELLSNQSGSAINLNLNNEGVYYVMVTKDGCVNTSAPLEITSYIPERLVVYPNPNSGTFQILMSGITENDNDRTISLYDTKGSLVYTKHYENIPLAQKFYDLSVENLATGIYMLVVVDKNGKKISKCKVMIQ